MAEYRVTWDIDVEADTPQAAAAEALAIQRDPNSLATVFRVARWSGRRMSKAIPIETFVDEIEIDVTKEKDHGSKTTDQE